jgi:ubiquitin C-terminal hydrolase
VADEVIADWDSPATGKKGFAKKTMRFAAFPKYLCLRLNRYVFTVVERVGACF